MSFEYLDLTVWSSTTLAFSLGQDIPFRVSVDPIASWVSVISNQKSCEECSDTLLAWVQKLQPIASQFLTYPHCSLVQEPSLVWLIGFSFIPFYPISSLIPFLLIDKYNSDLYLFNCLCPCKIYIVTLCTCILVLY